MKTSFIEPYILIVEWIILTVERASGRDIYLHQWLF